MDGSASTAAPQGPWFGDVRRYAELASTSSTAAALVRAAPELAGQLVVVADHQSAGRGRLGRRWEAPAGSSLLVSVALGRPGRPGRGRLPAPLATLAMAVAVVEACTAVTAVDLALKWPNDVVTPGGAKVGGVLGEAVGQGADQAVVVGLGLNLNWGTANPPANGASLDRLAGGAVDPEAVLTALLDHLARALRASPEALLERYRGLCTTLGRRARVDLGPGRPPLEGTAVAVTDEGHLVLDDGNGSHVVAAGDVVHLRPA